MNVNVRIGRLVLDGMPLNPAERAQLGAAFEASLADLLRRSRSALELRAGAAMPAVRAPALFLDGALDKALEPAQIGTRIAHAVFAALQRALSGRSASTGAHLGGQEPFDTAWTRTEVAPSDGPRRAQPIGTDHDAAG
jgi:hypothetical protein